MLDKFLAVSYSGELKKTASRQLVDKLKTYPIEELKKLSSGDPHCKLAYADACGPGRDDTWLGKYMNTPLFAKAVELEKSLVQLDMEDQQMRAQERAVRPDPNDTWMKRDAINLQKRMLDLDLVMAQNGGDPTAEAAPPEAGGEPPAPPAPKAPKEEAPPAAGGEPSEEELLAALEAEGGGGEAGPPQAPQQPPKPKAPPQQAQGGEGEEEEETEEGQPPKKDDKPKGMSVEVKQSSAKLAAATAVSAGVLFAKLASAESKVRREVAKKFPELAKEKKAAAEPEGHHIRRALLGNPISSAIEARPGSRLDAAGEAYGHGLAEQLKGGLKGGVLGAGLGAAGGLAAGLINKAPLGRAVGMGAGLGGGAGLLAGDIYGAFKGNHGAEASRIHGARSKHRDPEEKVANMLGALGGAASAAKGLATSAHAAGGLPQVAKSFGNVAKTFAQKNPLTAAGIAGAGGLVAGKALTPSQPRM